MRIKSEKKTDVRRPDLRSIKIQPRTRDNRSSATTTSEIKLCGNWLEDLGFHYERRVVVTTMKELLIIRLQAE